MPIKYIISFITILVFSVFASAYAATVRFYDDNLNLVEAKDYKSEETINFTKIDVSDNIAFWYLAEGSIPLDNYTVVNDMNIYSVPMVKEITSENELKNIRNFLSGRYMLVKDINLTKAWIPIGNGKQPFMGVFNGGGHKINGLWVDNTSGTTYIGLFGRTNGSVIKDISVSIDVEKGGLSGRSHVGTIVGSALNTTIINSHSEGLIKGGIIIGGIVGSIIHSTIRESSSSCDIEAYASAGGIVGIASHSYLEGVSSSGAITLKEDSTNLTDLYSEALGQDIFIDYKEYIGVSFIHGFRLYSDGLSGGIVGYSYLVTIADSYFTGKIKGRHFSGGITGFINNEEGRDGGIANSHVSGSIEGYDDSGGIAGYTSYGYILNSSFKGTIKGGKKIGGIAGTSICDNIVNTHVDGSVEGNDSSGGIVGIISYGSIIHSYFKGKLKGEIEVGGIVGAQWSNTSIENSYSLVFSNV
jgi:hypothetical protein